MNLNLRKYLENETNIYNYAAAVTRARLIQAADTGLPQGPRTL